MTRREGRAIRALEFRRNGSIGFRTHGRYAKVRFSDERSVRIIVRVGDQSSRAVTSVRAKSSGLRFP